MSFLDFFFFFGLIFLLTSVFIGIITLKNECIFLQNEVYHLESIYSTHTSKVRVLKGNVNNLSRRGRIEEIARDSFNLEVPSPESLIVYIGEIDD